MLSILNCVFILLLLAGLSTSFHNVGYRHCGHFREVNVHMSFDEHSSNTPRSIQSRGQQPLRTLRELASFSVLAGAFSGLFADTKIAEAVADPTGKVVVLGSGGKTGTLVVNGLVKRGIPVLPTSRTGLSKFTDVDTAFADVTKIDSLEAVFKVLRIAAMKYHHDVHTRQILHLNISLCHCEVHEL